VTVTPLALFTKAPASHDVKTRLSSELDRAERAALYRAFVTDVLTTCRAVAELNPELWVAGDLDDPFVREIASALHGSHPARVSLQADGDLGTRMALALDDMIARDGRGLIIGTDAPTLPASILRRAVTSLGHADVVLGPSADGGFYLVGAKARVPPIFEEIRYSTRHALGDTLAAASRASLEVSLLSPWYDVDTPWDLGLLRAHLSVDPGAAPQTATRLFPLTRRPG
jgi:rSAM/selenodomain-associated transferase 1